MCEEELVLRRGPVMGWYLDGELKLEGGGGLIGVVIIMKRFRENYIFQGETE